MPESQYMLRYDMRQHNMDDVQLEGELPCAGPAGTVCIIHYDTLHRKMASKLDQTRHMLKFIVCRMSEPLAPSWDHDPARAIWPASDHPQSLVHEAVWRWHLGAAAPEPPPPPATDVAALAAGLRSEDDELEAVDAAYTLALLGEAEAAAALVAALPETTPPQQDWSGNGNGGTDTATSAGYGLVNMRGTAALDALRALLSDPSQPAEVRARGIDALADMGLAAEPALPELLTHLSDEVEDVRRRAAEAIGLAGQAAGDDVAYGLATQLAVLLAQDGSAEVRREAAFSLGRLASDGEGVVDALRGACHTANGHVKGYAAKALERIATPESLRAAIEYLQTVRYA